MHITHFPYVRKESVLHHEAAIILLILSFSYHGKPEPVTKAGASSGKRTGKFSHPGVVLLKGVPGGIVISVRYLIYHIPLLVSQHYGVGIIVKKRSTYSHLRGLYYYIQNEPVGPGLNFSP